MEEVLLNNANEFYLSGQDNLLKKRFNVSFSDFFKSIVVFCDYLLYKNIKRLPKNHSERFILLEKYFPEIYQEVSKRFKPYTFSYNSIISEEEAVNLKEYARKIKEFVKNI